MVQSNIKIDGGSESGVTGFGERTHRPESTISVYIRALLQIHLERPEDLAADPKRAVAVSRRHDRLVRNLLTDSDGLVIDRRDDGVLLLFERPAEAVTYALAYHQELAILSAEENAGLEAGVGIHLGEISMTERRLQEADEGAPASETEGLAKLVVHRIATLASGGQILLTQMAFELARRAMVGVEAPELEWASRGKYEFAGLNESYGIFEVGAQGATVAESPSDTETAKRLRGRAKSTPGADRRLVGRRAILATSAVAVLMGGLWWLLQSMGVIADSPFSRTGERHLTMAILGFKNLSVRPETQWLSSNLPERFGAELGAASDLTVISGQRVATMKTELSLPTAETLAADTLRDIRRHLGTDYVLVGSYLVLEPDGQLRLSLHLQPTAGGETISINATGRESGLVELVSRAARDVREELGLDRIKSEGAPFQPSQ